MNAIHAGPRRLGQGVGGLAVAGLLLMGLSACEKSAPEPQNEQTGAMMPDTSQAVPNPPDAGATGVVPAEGAVPVQPDPVGGAVGAPDVPVQTPDVEPR